MYAVVARSTCLNLCLHGGSGWWFGSLGIDGLVNLEKISNPVNNEIVENKENKFKTTMIATICTYLISNNFT